MAPSQSKAANTTATTNRPGVFICVWRFLSPVRATWRSSTARDLRLAVRVERVVHTELAAHVVEIVGAEASETVGDCFETDPLLSPISFGRIRCANDLRQLDERRVFVQVIAPDYCVEGTVLAVMPEFGIRNVEHGSFSNGRPVRVVWQKDEFGIGIDEFPDQPWTRNLIDLCFFTRDPFHADDSFSKRE